MSKNFLFLFVFFCLSFSSEAQNAVVSESRKFVFLDSLFNIHHYFLMADEFNKEKNHLSEKEKLMLEAKLNSAFNKKEISNRTIEALLSKYNSELTDSEKLELLEIEMNNNVLLFNYKKALENAKKAITFSSLLTKEEMEDFENNIIIFEILKNTPPQTIAINETSLKITKDAAGLSRIPVKIHGLEQIAVFDTGANFSVISDSLALKTGVKILDGTFKVTAITGNKIDSKIAVADSLRLGNVLVEHTVFLVLPEASLSFPQINYKIGSIIGFPVIEALKEIKIVNDSLFNIPKNQSSTGHGNLALKFLTPVLEVIENNRSLPFTFDSGATETMLYNPYLKDYEEKIKSDAVLDSVQIGGAGGSKFVNIYTIPFTGKISGKEFILKNATVNSEENPGDKKGIYGNLGKDVLNQFDTLTINFEKMFLKLD